MQTCSACQRPLERGQKAKIVGTEVFHRACVGRTSTLQRAARKLRDLESELARTRAERDIAIQNAREADLRRGRLQMAVESMSKALLAEQSSVESYRRAYTRVDEANLGMSERIDILAQDVRNAQADAVAQRARADAAEKALAERTPSVTDDLPEDATSARFSLLELK